MLVLVEKLLAACDAKIPAMAQLHRYEVTARQGRYTVRRKLLRALHQRFRVARESVRGPSLRES
jgi:hypothetical protein